MPDIALVADSPRPYVGIRRTVHHTKLAPYFSEVIPRVAAWVTARGEAPASPPIALWHAMDPETGDCDAQAGCFVDTDLAGDGEVTPGRTPGGECLVLLHVGGYDSIPKAWGRLFARAGELGREPGLGWEVYVDDPQVVARDQLRTELHLALGPARRS